MLRLSMIANKNLLLAAFILALCIISFIHIQYYYPLNDADMKLTIIQANVDFEDSLCEVTVKHQLDPFHYCPKNGIVTTPQIGRLGNQIWVYASVFVFARENGLEPYVPRCIRDQLEEVFESLTVPALDEIAHCPIDYNAFAHSLDEWNGMVYQSILFHRHTRLARTVLAWMKDVWQEFTFRRELRENADNVLRSANKQKHKLPVYIGVHVRRTDYAKHLPHFYNITLIGSLYFYKAMYYFEQKYQPVVFVVVSDDMDWCRKHLTQKPNVYIVGNYTSPGQDLAIMAACNHSIIDYGTFGDWGAILAGGETIVYNATGQPTTKFAKVFPKWHIFS